MKPSQAKTRSINTFIQILSVIPCLLIASLALAEDKLNKVDGNPDHSKAHWQNIGERKLQSALQNLKNINLKAGAAKNIILFLGDGMGVSTVTAARILEGQQRGENGEENFLSFEHFPFSGLVKTYNTDAQTPDSAGTMTAIVTGVKTRAGVLSIAPDAERGNCLTQKGKELPTILELFELAGKATGIVSTARITHATPAALYAKSVDRNWENDSKLGQIAASQGCKDIAEQLLGFAASLKQKHKAYSGDGIEVVLGGGLDNFRAKRTDKRDLIEEWRALYPKGQFVTDINSLSKLTNQHMPVLGLFSPSHMNYHKNNPANSPQPSLSEMTAKSIELLKGNKKGYFLMVESGRIDHSHHAGNAYNALNDTIELSRAVATAKNLTNDKDTLIIVTADHSHVFTMAGYPKRGNPILGKVINVGDDEFAKAADGLPYTTLSYANGLGFHNLESTDADAVYKEPPHIGRANLSKVETTHPGFHQEALIPMYSETHGGEDVAVYATGPSAALLSGVLEQNVIFNVMLHASGLKNITSQN